ncbi:hypothetical protein J5N97_018359 [Dioscorea zingiberensis]|uniref:Uncharacterized protein n=1 Tax=Dioscorea zingiberensis TaxID=325984 RepID=A0A9D5CNM9_9LILI|nr:hypothetical protein J5N97_018359 [Dioscorea zingiberensis]
MRGFRLQGFEHLCRRSWQLRIQSQALQLVGAMAHGKFEQDYTDEFISISKAPLNVNACSMKICVALEESRDICCFNSC